jgi:hypothetical protein
MIMNTTENLKPLAWKSGVLAPVDAKRPRCKVITSLDGVSGKIEEDATDLVDWLIVIAYEAEEK